jgi:hypothetical protein
VRQLTVIVRVVIRHVATGVNLVVGGGTEDGAWRAWNRDSTTILALHHSARVPTFVEKEGTDAVLVEPRQLAILMRKCDGVFASRRDVCLARRTEALEIQRGLVHYNERACSRQRTCSFRGTCPES